MNKSIIVIDTPEVCCQCRFSGADGDCCCLKDKLISEEEYLNKKPDWCPLQPMPEKKALCGRYPQPDGLLPSYKAGYNACIDKIMARQMDAKERGKRITWNNEKGFYIPCKSWYADAIGEKKEYIIIGMYTEYGGTQGEFRIEREKLGIRLKAYNDSWETLSQMPELINLLAKIQRSGNEPTLEEFAEMLKELDYEDRTEYERSDI